MDKERILLIGHDGPFRGSHFNKPPNLAEFNTVIWYPNSIRREWAAGSVLATVVRLSELIAWIKRGNSLVIIGAPDAGLSTQYRQNDKPYSLDLLKTEIFGGITFHRKSGSLVEYCGPDSLSGLLSELTNLISYDAILESKDLFPLYRVSTPPGHETQIVGGFRKLGAGIVAQLPLCVHDSKAVGFYKYHHEVASILAFLNEPTVDDTPEWIEDFQTATEQQLNDHIRGAQKQILELETNIVGLKQGVSTQQISKRLFTATGDTFSEIVAETLRELGLTVVEGPKHRADLIAWDGQRLAAIEVKGLEGPAKEKNVGQTKRWTADVSAALSIAPDEVAGDAELAVYQRKLSDLGVALGQFDLDCKGIVVLNTHRKLPLDQRPEGFGEPIRRFLARSGACGLTGLQLYALLHESRSSPERKGQIVDKLFSTNGVLDEGLAWSKYLTKTT